MLALSALFWFLKPSHAPIGDPSAKTTTGPPPSLESGRVDPATTTDRAIPEPSHSPSRLDPLVEQIASPTASHGFAARLQAIRGVAGALSGEDIDALMGFLRADAEPLGLTSDNLLVLQNEVLDLLVRHADQVADDTEPLGDVYRDAGLSPALRDYVVQHFDRYYLARWTPPPAGQGDPVRDRFLNTFWRATEETGGTIAGTALLGLERLSRDRPEIDRLRLGVRATMVARDTTASDSARVAAIQVAAKAGEATARDLARALARSGESIPVRMSAIAALGELGIAEDRAWLEDLASNPETNSRLLPAAAAAIRKLQ